jgi:hypothetical protein
MRLEAPWPIRCLHIHCAASSERRYSSENHHHRVWLYSWISGYSGSPGRNRRRRECAVNGGRFVPDSSGTMVPSASEGMHPTTKPIKLSSLASDVRCGHHRGDGDAMPNGEQAERQRRARVRRLGSPPDAGRYQGVMATSPVP